MTPYQIILGLLESGPKRKAQLVAALGNRGRVDRAVAQLRERQDIQTIGKGLYALRGAA